MIKAEFPGYKMQAELVGVDHIPYQNAYNALKVYLEPLLVDMGVSSNVVRATFLTHFQNYYNARGNLLYAVFSYLKTALDETARVAIEAGLDAVRASSEAEGASIQARNANRILTDIASDNVLTAQEKLPLRREYRRVQSEWQSYLAQAQEYDCLLYTSPSPRD